MCIFLPINICAIPRKYKWEKEKIDLSQDTEFEIPKEKTLVSITVCVREREEIVQ